jgi:hypothetical protein
MHTLTGPYEALGAFVRAEVELQPNIRQLRPHPRKLSGWVMLDPGLPQSGLCPNAVERFALRNNIRNWVVSAYGPVRREFVYQVVFAFALDVSEGNDAPSLEQRYKTQAFRTNDASEMAISLISRTQPEDPEVIGHLGLDILRHFHVILDPFSKRCTLVLPNNTSSPTVLVA